MAVVKDELIRLQEEEFTLKKINEAKGSETKKG